MVLYYQLIGHLSIDLVLTIIYLLFISIRHHKPAFKNVLLLYVYDYNFLVIINNTFIFIFISHINEIFNNK